MADCSDHNRSLNLDVSNLKIYFYDFINNVNISSKIKGAVIEMIPLLKDSERKIILFVPGYKCFIQRDIEEWVRQAFKNTDVYLFIADHSAYTFETEDKLGSYSRSVLYSFYIGEALGKLLAYFTEAGYSEDKIHGIGHSLGSQMLGYTSDAYFRETNQRIGRVTGLDPAGPCFVDSALEDQIRSGVAKYVEVYHCNAGHLGTTNMIADVDFVFNKHGKVQPGCEGLELEDTAKCYHKACVKFWTASVRNPDLYLARSCHSYEAWIEGLCSEAKTTTAGYHNPGNATGVYYVSTENYLV
ncbi:pancreatic lipase-related protein 2-like [Epargyreus clarus]|uniref:pancreatic lipase-related protein 2-like n=1 Tax=Epargyreus clarus TaxID=520877 RepID=UPI003C2CC607